MLAEDALEQRDPIDTIAQAVAPLAHAAEQLQSICQQFTILDEYSAAWAAADELCQPALIALAQALTHARGALLAGQIEPAAHAAIEQRIARIIGVAMRLN